MSSSSQEDVVARHSFKIVLLGGAAVGKTAILRRLQHNCFEPGYTPTVGTDFCKAEVQITQTAHATLQVWDVGSHVSSVSMAANTLHGCDAVLAVFDITRQQTFSVACDWLALLQQMFGVLPYVAIVASKADTAALQQQAAQLMCTTATGDVTLYSYAVCARSGWNVSEMFRCVAADLAGVPLQEQQPPAMTATAHAVAAAEGLVMPHQQQRHPGSALHKRPPAVAQQADPCDATARGGESPGSNDPSCCVAVCTGLHPRAAAARKPGRPAGWTAEEEPGRAPSQQQAIGPVQQQQQQPRGAGLESRGSSAAADEGSGGSRLPGQLQTCRCCTCRVM